MSHDTLGKQSCLAWLITTDTWASRTRGWAHSRQVQAQACIQPDSHLHLSKSSDISHATTSSVLVGCTCTWMHKFWFHTDCFFSFFFSKSFRLAQQTVSGLVNLSLPAAGSCSPTRSHGYRLSWLTAPVQTAEILPWVTKSTCPSSSCLCC